MPSILDIAPPEIAAETINIRGSEVQVRGIRNREWAVLLRRFPLLQKQAAGKAVSEEEMAVVSIEMMPAAIALVLGETEDVVVERLSDAEQAEVFGIIMRLTNPPAPLAESPVAAGQAGNGAAMTTTPQPLSS